MGGTTAAAPAKRGGGVGDARSSLPDGLAEVRRLALDTHRHAALLQLLPRSWRCEGEGEETKASVEEGHAPATAALRHRTPVMVPVRLTVVADAPSSTATPRHRGACGSGGGRGHGVLGLLAPPTVGATGHAVDMTSLVMLAMQAKLAPGCHYSHGAPPQRQVLWHVAWDLVGRREAQRKAAEQVLALTTLMRLKRSPGWGRRLSLLDSGLRRLGECMAADAQPRPLPEAYTLAASAPMATDAARRGAAGGAGGLPAEAASGGRWGAMAPAASSSPPAWQQQQQGGAASPPRSRPGTASSARRPSGGLAAAGAGSPLVRVPSTSSSANGARPQLDPLSALLAALSDSSAVPHAGFRPAAAAAGGADAARPHTAPSPSARAPALAPRDALNLSSPALLRSILASMQPQPPPQLRHATQQPLASGGGSGRSGGGSIADVDGGGRAAAAPLTSSQPRRPRLQRGCFSSPVVVAELPEATTPGRLPLLLVAAAAPAAAHGMAAAHCLTAARGAGRCATETPHHRQAAARRPTPPTQPPQLPPAPATRLEEAAPVRRLRVGSETRSRLHHLPEVGSIPPPAGPGLHLLPDPPVEAGGASGLHPLPSDPVALTLAELAAAEEDSDAGGAAQSAPSQQSVAAWLQQQRALGGGSAALEPAAPAAGVGGGGSGRSARQRMALACKLFAIEKERARAEAAARNAARRLQRR